MEITHSDTHRHALAFLVPWLLFVSWQRKETPNNNKCFSKTRVSVNTASFNFYINDITTWQHKVIFLIWRLSHLIINYCTFFLVIAFSSPFVMFISTFIFLNHIILLNLFFFFMYFYTSSVVSVSCYLRCSSRLVETMSLNCCHQRTCCSSPCVSIVSHGGMKLTEENRSTRGKPVSVQLCPLQIPHGIKRASPARVPIPTAWAFRYLPCWSSMTH
jgi:hypothetical protein